MRFETSIRSPTSCESCWQSPTATPPGLSTKIRTIDRRPFPRTSRSTSVSPWASMAGRTTDSTAVSTPATPVPVATRRLPRTFRTFAPSEQKSGPRPLFVSHSVYPDTESRGTPRPPRRVLELRGQAPSEAPDGRYDAVRCDGDILTVPSRTYLDLALAPEQGADGHTDGDAEEVGVLELHS